jgi:hypothetical protein
VTFTAPVANVAASTDTQIGTVTVPANYNKTVVYSIPINVVRVGTVPAAQLCTHTHTLNSISAKVYTNADVFLFNATVTFNQTLPIQKITSHYLITSFSYQQCFGVATVSFPAPINNAAAVTYRVRINVAETYSYFSLSNPETVTQSGWQVNSSVTGNSGNGITFDQPNGTYAAASVSSNLSQATVESYGSGSLGVGSLVASEQRVVDASYLNNVQANSITCPNFQGSASFTGDVVFASNVVMKSPVGAYLMNGSSPYDPVPIFSSVKSLSLDNADDAWTVFPGYSIVLYRDLNYVTQQQTIDNTNGVSPVCVASANPNSNSSCRLYYRGVEQTLNLIS